MAQIIKANGEELNIIPKDGPKLSLAQMQEVVEGYIELVPINNPDYADKMMFCNEDGHRLGKEFNSVASMMAGQPILGNVLVCEKGEVD
jgi:hypothetical protein